jgi:repressor LexA
MVQTTGYPPTLRQIGVEFGISSTNGVRSHLRALHKKGYIKRSAYTSRGIELLGGLKRLIGKEVAEIPLVGRVAAGVPILAVENIEDTLLLPKDLLKGEDLFALEVKGDSMIEAGILEGDYVIVKPQATADNGDIVVVLLEEEATVKRFYRESHDKIRLQPANARLAPMVVDSVTVLGRVIGLLRTKF